MTDGFDRTLGEVRAARADLVSKLGELDAQLARVAGSAGGVKVTVIVTSLGIVASVGILLWLL